MLRVVNPYIYAQNFTLYLCVCVCDCVFRYVSLYTRILRVDVKIIATHDWNITAT